MTPAARIQAASEILDTVLDGMPAEAALTRWARGARYAGSKDRAAVRDIVFDILRRKRSLACLGGAETGRALVLGRERADGREPDLMFTGEGHAPAPLSPKERASGAAPETEGDRLDLPDWLLPDLHASLGDGLPEVAKALAARAPVFLRVNLRKTDRDAARAALLREGIATEPHPAVVTALHVTDGARGIATSRAYAAGLVELQDAASQSVVASLPLDSVRTVLDYCAGGGGKILAIGGRCDARLSAHDADLARMRDLPQRAARAGLSVERVRTDALAKAAPFDLVLADVPCSGSGAWRRSPDAKWRLTRTGLDQLCATQDAILDRAAALVAPGGVLAYATCSILDRENAARVDSFLQRHRDWRRSTQLHWLPGPLGDGFFVAHLTRV